MYWIGEPTGVGFHASTQPTFILYLIPPTYLELEGFSLDRITGSHHIFKRNDIILVIPVHNKKVKSVYIRRVLEIIGDN